MALGSLPSLNYLDLSENQFSGQIPPELGQLKLVVLNLSSNQLSGMVPIEFQNGAYERRCCFLHPVHGTGDPIAVGISPEKLFAVRSRYRRRESRSISAGIGTTKEFCNKRRYSSLKQLRISGNSPGIDGIVDACNFRPITGRG
ncbi:hypothetical protein AAG906_002760 [Vitis piasezkii]